MKLPSLLGLSLCLATSFTIAQSTPLPEAPIASLTHEQMEDKFGVDSAYLNFFAGLAATPGASAIRATGTAGVTIGQYKTGRRGNIGAAPTFELGLLGPIPGGYQLDGFVSVDEVLAAKRPRKALYETVTAGYTRFFATGDAINFGFGIDFGKDDYTRLTRIELRDYYLIDGPHQHIVGLRIAFGKLVSD